MSKSPAFTPLAVDASLVPSRSVRTVYPEPFAGLLEERDKRALGTFFGLTNFGVNLTRLAPGAISALRHAHSRPDEFVYILEGHPTLHTDEGVTALAPGMCTGFRAGTGDAHQLANESDLDVVYLEIGDRTAGDEASYPDDDLVARESAGAWIFFHKDGRSYSLTCAPADQAREIQRNSHWIPMPKTRHKTPTGTWGAPDETRDSRTLTTAAHPPTRQKEPFTMTPRTLLPLLLAASSISSAHGLTLHGPVAISGDRLSHAQVNDSYGCTGANRSPALRWVRVPINIRSFALTIFDVDAPTGSGWWHWVVYDIPANAKGLDAGAGGVANALLPHGTRQARNDFGEQGYGGACPPKGDKPHRYVITLYALDVATLGAPGDASPAMVGYLLQQHRIAQSSVTATYSR
jgi:Raf kinase inhibitor-like YbhB/YbcL family protein